MWRENLSIILGAKSSLQCQGHSAASYQGNPKWLLHHGCMHAHAACYACPSRYVQHTDNHRAKHARWLAEHVWPHTARVCAGLCCWQVAAGPLRNCSSTGLIFSKALWTSSRDLAPAQHNAPST